jgi:hypothetical protein
MCRSTARGEMAQHPLRSDQPEPALAVPIAGGESTVGSRLPTVGTVTLLAAARQHVQMVVDGTGSTLSNTIMSSPRQPLRSAAAWIR